LRASTAGSAGSDQMVEGTIDLRDYVEPIVRHKYLVLGTLVLVNALAILYTLTRPPVYTSTSTVLVKPTGVNLTELGGLGTERLVNLQTEAQLVESTTVAVRAAEILGAGATPPQLLRHVTAEPVPDSQTIDISYSDGEASSAQKGAMAFARAYLDNRREEAQALVDDQVQQITASISAAQAQLRELNQIIADALVTSTDAQDARAERASVQAQLEGLQVQVASVSLLNTDPGAIIVEALVPKTPSSPNHTLNIAIGVFLGLLLGVGAGLVRGRLDQRLHKTTDLEGALSVPLLAAIPMVPDERPGPEELIALRDPSAPASEAYRALRTTLFASLRGGEGTIMVVSSVPGEGKTTVAANLAITLAYAGRSVILVSADMRRPRVHELFGLPNTRGLSSFLTGTLPWEDCVVSHEQLSNLAVCPGGPVPGEPVELLQSKRMSDLLAELRRLAEFVILDCPPVLTVADTVALASLTDSALFVVDSSGTRRTAVVEARRRLQQVGTEMLGGILNKVPPAGRSGYSYSYGYGYGYGYGPDGSREGRAVKRERGAKPVPARPDEAVPGESPAKPGESPAKPGASPAKPGESPAKPGESPAKPDRVPEGVRAEQASKKATKSGVRGNARPGEQTKAAG
jgi:succinoglycan biosynthesis transport protein ExoP